MSLPDIGYLELNLTEELYEADGGTASFLFDFDTKEFITTDGKLIEIDNIEALKQWIRYAILDLEIDDLLIGNNYSQQFIESEVKREVEQALLKNKRITAISNLSIIKNNPNATISFTVNHTLNMEVTV